jgi:hypothetical protein
MQPSGRLQLRTYFLEQSQTFQMDTSNEETQDPSISSRAQYEQVSGA